MIPVEAHLFLNHVPIVGLIFGLVFVTVGIVRTSAAALRVGLQTFVVVGLTALPVGASGLVSAKVLAGAPWLDAGAVAGHQLAGIVTVALFIGLAVFSSAALFALRNTGAVPRWAARTVLALAIAGVGATLWTAYLGGALRHNELRGTSTSSAVRR